MKDQRIEDQIKKLIREINIFEGKPVNYNPCPYLSKCSMPLAKVCISFEYRECSYYRYYENFLK